MRVVLMIMLMLCGCGVFAQDTMDVFTYGGISDDVCRRIIPTDSGYYLVGTTASFGRGPNDIYIVQVDEEFNYIRSKTLGQWDVDFMTDAQPMGSNIVIVGATNVEQLGEYTGKIWVVDSSMNLAHETSIDYGQTTFPKKVQVKGSSIYVGGEFNDSKNGYFLSKFSADLQQEFKREFELDEIGRIDSWFWYDTAFVTAHVIFDDAYDSLGVISFIDSAGQIKKSIVLPDTLGIVRDISLMSDSNFLLVGDRMDTAFYATERVGSMAKLAGDLSHAIWVTERYFPIECLVRGVAGLELSFDRIVLVAKTNYFFSTEKYSIIIQEYSGGGSFISHGGSYYGSVEDDIAHDAIANSGDSVFIAGYSNGYGAGVKDFYVLRLPVRSDTFVFDVESYEDTLTKVLSIDEINHKQSKHDVAILSDGVYKPVYGLTGQGILYSMDGNAVMRLDSEQVNTLHHLPTGYYILVTDQERMLLYSP